ncbi:hypothetical protein D9756_005613 [Leucocoprinus leucothites]|uniref:Uncharacterized protein n=1 Tax=Leucocoprinus leucothites TaxID=201217 RepID=A0A8H5FZR1_9AGAR|nr:hypothetical protein D9756_005613 [Leucoagaricus leucothites]
MERDLGPLEDFFASYAAFTYNPSAPSTREFRRLAKANQWEPKTGPLIGANKAFKTALIRQFNVSYGTNKSSLPDWQGVLRQMGVSDPPHTISGCQEIVRNSYVNLVDLVDARGDPTKIVRTFPTEKALSSYSKRTKKIFPKEGAKAGGILEYFLRHIFQPGDGTGKRTRRRKKKAKTQ